MSLLSCHTISKSYASKLLFQEISFSILAGDKIGLIGPNGSGKSTLLKIIAGLESPDSGSVTAKGGIKVGYVPQDAQFKDETVHNILMQALSQQNLPLYEKETLVAITLSRMGFKEDQALTSSLSGGWKKRLDIARQIILEPDILLLDEPTNHLDLEGVMWLEKFLAKEGGTFLVISHDRSFLEQVTDKVMELNRAYPKGLFAVDGSYSDFLEKKELFLEGQAQSERSLASKLRREIEWLKQGVKARTTKSRSRIQEAHKLKGEFKEINLRNQVSQISIDFAATQRETKKLVAVKNIGKTLGARQLFSQVSFILSPGTRLGIVGLNGSGKSTLLKLLAKELSPDSGTIKFAEGVKVVYFDQQRAQLPNVTLRRALAPEGDRVFYRGQAIHVNGWCKKFLFDPDRLDLPVQQLSGGEKARVLIARLMLEPADVLLLDEPTNDLDLSTLEFLEDNLSSFPGAVVLITHDRYMLSQVANTILGLGTQSDDQLFADLEQWQAFREKSKEKEKEKTVQKREKTEKEGNGQKLAAPPVKKLSYMEKKELEQMEEVILKAEEKIAALHQEIANKPADNKNLEIICQQLAEQEKALENLYHRWQELLAKSS